jgi:FRG domain
MADETIKSLGDFTKEVVEFRDRWRVSDDKELWFRGEDRDFEETRLVPKLYRSKDGEAIKVSRLLKIEDQLCNEFSRLGTQLCEPKIDPEYEYWDWYFLMQHHGAVTRLLDWTDGALIALHFASKLRKDDEKPRFVYLLAPDRLKDKMKTLHGQTKRQWKAYIKKHPFYIYTDREDDWEHAYLPADKDDLKELNIPGVPLLLDFPHITRRVGAQRSRFIVLGTNPYWLRDRIDRKGFPLEVVEIDGKAVSRVRRELRDCGITESVIFPDLDGVGREVNQLFDQQK